MMDVQIAACAWIHGHGVATDNRRDFDRLGAELARLFPAARPLEVADAPTVVPG